MMTSPSDHDEEIRTFYDRQFADWPEVRRRYLDLGASQRRTVTLPGCAMPIVVQCNPARMVSTAAKTDKDSVAARPCFLCSKNRPEQQIAGTTLEGWEILVNPFPILPVHFTIVAREHTPQGEFPLDAVEFVDRFPTLCAFFNGARAGASAPDHLHFQAVLRSELHILREVERRHPAGASSQMLITDLHAPLLSMVIAPDLEGMQLLARLPKVCGTDAATGLPAPDLVNTFVWKDDAGYLRAMVFPRTKHRPAAFFAEGDDHVMVSPGALDMAGILITPRREDFDKLTPEQIAGIYKEVSTVPEGDFRL